MSQIRVRKYDARRDLDGLYDLAEVAYAEDYARIGRPAKAGMDRERRTVALLSVLERALPRLRDVQPGFVCEADGELVSVVLFARVGLVGDRWSIETVATHPDHRRQGLASALLKRAIESIRGRGGRLCTLKVRSDNEEAYGLYRSLGFQHYDTTVHVKLDRGIPAEIPRPGLEAYDARAVSTKVRFGSWRERHDLAVRETPDDVQRTIPLSPAQFRRSAFFPYLAPVVTRLAGQRVERHLVSTGGATGRHARRQRRRHG
jgi:ribosomal protein S18 acetylase RimI-like enzyme